MLEKSTDNRNKSSFRDPSGFIFSHEGTLFRQVNKVYQAHYDLLMDSGLYSSLVKDSLLISHEEVNLKAPEPEINYKIIKPEQISFISYPYEWCFSQLKDAALLTLEIQRKSIEFGMSLKDCSAYNIQFYKGKPVFIDTLSFEKYRKGEPWVAYKQFCQHFLAPLALMSYTDVRLSQLMKIYIDGIPLDMTSKLLPYRTQFTFSLKIHIHLHAKSQKRYADKAIDTKRRKFSKLSFIGLVDNLQSTVKKMDWNPKGTEWGEYYEDTNYSRDSHDHKKQLVKNYLEMCKPNMVWDLGANTGLFSQIASNMAIPTISFDIDEACVEKNYRSAKSNHLKDMLPLLQDLTNTSPGIGWNNEERMPIQTRGPVDAVFALALIHHLAISNNLPFTKIASFLREICTHLIIEFVPKSDSQVKRLLATREDIFPDYTKKNFELEFRNYFTIQESDEVKGSERTMYLMKKV